MKYEGLFILNTAAKEESIKDTIDRLSAEITASGGKVETVQKMDKKPFARVSDKKHNAGYYVNIIFESEPGALAPLRNKLTLNDDVFRVLFTVASEAKPEGAVTAEAR